MTGGTGAGGGQLDLFGSTVPAPRDHDQHAPASGETNDVDLIRHTAGNAARGLYLLVGTSERVYARADGQDSVAVARVPRYEEAAVHQLIRRRWFTCGTGTHHVTCGAASLTGTAVLCPRSTRSRLQRWDHLARPTTWTPTASTARKDTPMPAPTRTGTPARTDGPARITHVDVVRPGRGLVTGPITTDGHQLAGEIIRDGRDYIVEDAHGTVIGRAASYRTGVARLARHYDTDPGHIEIDYERDANGNWSGSR